MNLAGACCLAALDPKDQYLPVWNVVIRPPDKSATCSQGCVQHNIGRWWDALLRLEAATGFEIPADLEAAMERHLHVCFDNKLQLLCEYPHYKSNHPHFIDVHSQREGLLALAARIRYRDDDWARETARKFVRALDRFITDEDLYNYDLLYEVAGKPREEELPRDTFESNSARMVTSTGRMIEGLTEVYTASGDDAALDLACRLAAWHVERTTREDGTDPDDVPFPKLHTHSYLNTLRGILRVGLLTRRQDYVDRIATTFRVAVRGGLTETGFVSHDWRGVTLGDSASTGDAAQIATELAVLGYGEFFDDAEKYIRARILPGQITGPLGLIPHEESEDDVEVLEARCLGAFAGIHRYHPNAWPFPTTDVTTSNIHGLCAVYARIFTKADHGLFVNLHFDCDHGPGRIRQKQGDSRRTVTITPNEPGRLFVRVPRWTPPGSVALSSGGRSLPVERVGEFARIRPEAWQQEVTMSYDLPPRTTTETVDETTYEFKWRGDHILSVSPNLTLLPFYPATPGGVEIGPDEISTEKRQVVMPE